QRNVCVLGDTWGGRHERDEVVAPVHRLDGTKPQFLYRSAFQDDAKQLYEAFWSRRIGFSCLQIARLRPKIALVRRKIASPTPQIDAGDDDFTVPSGL